MPLKRFRLRTAPPRRPPPVRLTLRRPSPRSPSAGRASSRWAPMDPRTLSATLIWRNVLTAPRRRFFHGKRAGLIALGGAVLLAGYAAAVQSSRSTIGIEVFAPMSYTSLAILGFAALLSSVRTFEDERDGRTLSLLALTDISREELLAGGILPGLLTSAFSALSFLPLFMLLVQAGGISAGQIVAAYAILIPTVFLCHALGLWLTTVVEKPSHIYVGMGLAILGYFVIFPLTLNIPFWLAGLDLLPFSPFVALAYVCAGKKLLVAALSGGLHILMSVVLLRSAWRRLADEFSDLEWITGEKDPLISLILGRPLQPGRRASRRVDSPDPVLWRETAIVYPGTRARAWPVAITVLITGVFFPMTMLVNIGSALEMLDSICSTLLTLSAVAFIPMFLFLCANAFAPERDSGTLELLLLSDIRPSRILWAKFRGAVSTLRPLFLTVVASAAIHAVFVYLHTLLSRYSFSASDLSPFFTTALYILACSVFAMALSLHLKRPTVAAAVGLTFVLFVILAEFLQDALRGWALPRWFSIHWLLAAALFTGSWVTALRRIRRPLRN